MSDSFTQAMAGPATSIPRFNDAEDSVAGAEASVKQERDFVLVQYDHDKESDYLDDIRTLITRDLSEPYSIYVYRYFLNNWPNLCWMILDKPTASNSKPRLLGVIICKLDRHHTGLNRGYIAMLAIETDQRRRGLGTLLIQQALATLQAQGADEVVLETEDSNKASLRLYERLGFVATKHLHRYYLNGNGALRLALFLTDVKRKVLQQMDAEAQGMSSERVRLGSEDSFEDWYDDDRYDGPPQGLHDEELYS